MTKYLILPMLVLFPLVGHAAGITGLESQLEKVGGEAFGTQGAPTELTTIVGTIINVLLGLLGVIFLILTIYAGFVWMTAGGNEEKVKKAQGILTTGIIGLVIVLAAYSIAGFVISQLATATGTA